MPLTRKTDYWAGLTVYPYSKLNPRRVVDILRAGASNASPSTPPPTGASPTPARCRRPPRSWPSRASPKPQIRKIMHDNPLAFYSQTPKFKPQLDLPYIDPATYQR
jgi:uncharacterized protein